MSTTPKVGESVKLVYAPTYNDERELRGTVVLTEPNGDFDIETDEGDVLTVYTWEQDRHVVAVEIPGKGGGGPAALAPIPPADAVGLPSGLDHWNEHRGYDRCPGSECLVPLGTAFDTIFVCSCGAGVRLYHDGINYRMREHERYQSAPLPSDVAVIR